MCRTASAGPWVRRSIISLMMAVPETEWIRMICLDLGDSDVQFDIWMHMEHIYVCIQYIYIYVHTRVCVCVYVVHVYLQCVSVPWKRCAKLEPNMKFTQPGSLNYIP